MQKFAIATVAILGVVCLLSSGCASIVSKSKWPVTINSNPSGANVTIKDSHGVEIQRGTTPMIATLPSKDGYFRSASYQFTFQKDEYSVANSALSAHLNGWYWGNILFGGLIGFVIVDPSTGAMWKLDDATCGNLSANPNALAKSTRSSVEKPVVPTRKMTSMTEDAAQQKLLKLKQLLEQGLVTPEEYETHRQAIVSGMSASAVSVDDSTTKYEVSDFRIVEYNFDAKDGKGSVTVDIGGKGFNARLWVVKNIGMICSSKNVALDAGNEAFNGAKYTILDESIKDGFLKITFEAVY